MLQIPWGKKRKSSDCEWKTMAFVVALKLRRGKREREKMHILQIYILVFPVASRAADAAEEIPQYEIQICPNNKHVNETTGSVFQKAKPLNQAKYRLSLEKA